MAIEPAPKTVRTLQSKHFMIILIKDVLISVLPTILVTWDQIQLITRIVFKVKNIHKIDCPTGTFSNFDNQRCVETCPSDTYSMPGSRPNCTYQCPQNYYASPLDRICKVATSCPTTPVRYFADDTTNLCVINCP